MNKQKLVIIGTVLMLPVFMSNIIYKKTSGAHPSSTGAPGEQTCAKSGCHSSAAVNAGTGVNTLIYPDIDSVYVCGATYNITVQVQKTGIEKFGFQLVALRDNDNTSIGELIITDDARTHLQTGTINSQERSYITHSTDGTPATSSGKDVWSFQWTAPPRKFRQHYILLCYQLYQ